MIYIFDIDGTLADNTHRLHFIPKGKPKDWAGFYAAAVDDQPIWEVITVARALHAAGHALVMMTGRPESSRALTVKWLSKYRVPFSLLLMRAEGDHREDYVVKSELFEVQKWKEIGGAFEDRQQVVKMFRERGIRVFQVAEGNY